uniref:EF-hand domain-containing protein n=1 Tax=Eutreptiella gymnastica TaxID=73025 RepID=A0A7S1HU95_9EUGL
MALEECGLNPMQAKFVLDLLKEEGFDLMDVLDWSHERQSAMLSEALPAAGTPKVEMVVERLNMHSFATMQQSASPKKSTPSDPPSYAAKPPPQLSEANQQGLAPRPPSSFEFYEPISPMKADKPGHYPRGHVEIEEAIQALRDASYTWTDIGQDASDLLVDEREEEEQAWHKLTARMTEGIRKFQSLTGPILVMGPSKLMAPPNIMWKKETTADGAGGATPTAPPTTPSKALAPRPPQSPMSPKEKRKARIAARQNGSLEVEAVQNNLKGKTDYKQLLHSQKMELAFGDRLHASYLQMLDKLLQDQLLIKAEVDANPWDLTLGVHRSQKERMLKRKILWMFGAAPEAEDVDDPAHVGHQSSLAIADELDALVKELDSSGDGLLQVDELAEALESKPEYAQRLMTLKINMALSTQNKLQSDNPMRRAMLQFQLNKLRQKLDLDDNGYLEYNELQAAADADPELQKKLSSIGIHVRKTPRAHYDAGPSMPEIPSPLKGRMASTRMEDGDISDC